MKNVAIDVLKKVDKRLDNVNELDDKAGKHITCVVVELSQDSWLYLMGNLANKDIVLCQSCVSLVSVSSVQ